VTVKIIGQVFRAAASGGKDDSRILTAMFATYKNGGSWEDERRSVSTRFRLARLVGCFGLALLWIHSLFAQSAPPKSTELQVISPASTYSQIDKLVREKKWTDVVALTGELRRKDPDNPVLPYWLGTSQLQLRQPVAAVQAFRSAERLGLNTALLHEGLGFAYYDLNQFALFEEQMKKASVSDPADSKPDYYLGFYRWTIRSDANGALEWFEKATLLAPEDWKSVYQSGNCLEQLGRLDDARARYASAISLLAKSGARFGWPYQGMARLLLDENPQGALDLAKKAVQLEPDEPSNHLVLAEVYARLGNLPDAIREAETATGKNPNDSKTHYALYKLYRQAGDPRAKDELKIFEQTKTLYDRD
jgi:tetratricopeptide (TPR) repeat protein